jgi:hypothetical protein
VNKMIFKSEIKNISLVERLIDDISVKYQLHSDIYGKLLLAVVEGVNNASFLAVDYEAGHTSLGLKHTNHRFDTHL